MSVKRKPADGQEERKPSQFPVYLSALVYPGAGQFAQGRWPAGVLYALSFTASFVWFIVCAVRIILAFYSVGLQFDTYRTSAVTNLPTKEAGLAFLAGVSLYILNLVDAFLAQQRRSRRWANGKWRTAEFLEEGKTAARKRAGA
jgi:hypothetical protein